MASLSDLVSKYELSNEISVEYAYQLGYAVKRFSLFLARDAKLSDLNEDKVNAWLKHERDLAEISDRSRANIRRSLLTIWKTYGKRFSRDSIRSVSVSPKNPEAWSYPELQAIANASNQLEGKLSNGLDRSLYMRTLLWFSFETGLRRRDVWTFDIERFDSQRLAAMTQHKTKRVHIVSITPETQSDIMRLAARLRALEDAAWRTPLRWPQSTSTFYDLMRKCRAIANVDARVRNRSLQHIRRTGATLVDQHGGEPWRFLGHSREGLDRKSYVDGRKTVRPTIPSPNRSQHHGCTND